LTKKEEMESKIGGLEQEDNNEPMKREKCKRIRNRSRKWKEGGRGGEIEKKED